MVVSSEGLPLVKRLYSTNIKATKRYFYLGGYSLGADLGSKNLIWPH